MQTMKKKMKSFWLMLITILFVIQGIMAQVPKVLPLVPFHNETLDLYGYKDSLTGKIILPPQFDFAEQYFEGLGMVTMDGKNGFVNTAGKLIIPCKYDFALNCKEGMVCVELDKKYGYYNNKGVLVIPLKFAFAWDFCQGLARADINGKMGFINKTGQFVIPAKYDWVDDFTDGCAIVRLDGKHGVIDKSGKFLVPLMDLELETFSKGIFRAMTKSRKYGLINVANKWVLDTVYQWINRVHATTDNQSLFYIKKDDLIGFINKQGMIVTEPQFNNFKTMEHSRIIQVVRRNDLSEEYTKYGLFDVVGGKILTEIKYDEFAPFSEGMAPFALGDKVGYLDESGAEAIPPVYEFAWEWKDSKGVVKKDGKMFIIDRANNVLSDAYDYIYRLKNSQFICNIGGVYDEKEGVTGGKYALLNTEGKDLTGVRYSYFEEFQNGVARVMNGVTVGLLYTNGTEKLFPDYHYLSVFEDSLAAFSSGGTPNEDGEFIGEKWGFMDMEGNIVLPALYDGCDMFNEGLAPVRIDQTLSFINKAGEVVIPLTRYESAGRFYDGMATVTKNGLMGYIDRNGTEVIVCQYDTASDFHDGVAMVSVRGVSILINKKGIKIRDLKYK